MSEAPILSIVGDKVALGPLHRGLLPLLQRWQNDFEVMRSLGEMRPTTAAPTNLFGIDRAHRTAAFGIVIGEKECWGRGYGTETTRLMLNHAFTALDLHNVRLWVYAFNERGIRAYTKAGFRVGGRTRESYRVAGRAYDTVLMDCLATEFAGVHDQRSNTTNDADST